MADTLLDSDSESVPRCIYCGSELTADTRVAHIIPSAIGGRKSSRRICCSRCNNRISTLENELTSDFRPVSGALGVVRGNNQPAPPSRFGTGAAEVAISNGRPSFTHVEISPSEDGRNFSIRAPNDLDSVALQIAHLLRRTNRTPEDLEEGRVSLETEAFSEYQDPQRVRFAIDIKARGRVLVKMLLELLGFYRGAGDFSQNRSLGAAAAFVLSDNGSMDVMFDTNSAGTGLLSHVFLPAFSHSLEVWSCGPLLLGKIILLGHFSFTVTLATEWVGGPIAIAHAVDPIAGEILHDEIVEHDANLPPLWSARRGISPAAQAQLNQRFGMAINDQLRKRWAEENSQILVSQWQNTIAEGEPINGNDVARLARTVVETVTPQILRRPTSRKISRADLMPLIRQHFASLERRR